MIICGSVIEVGVRVGCGVGVGAIEPSVIDEDAENVGVYVDILACCRFEPFTFESLDVGVWVVVILGRFEFMNF